MSNKVRRMLVLLLILLKEAGPTAACSSRCSSDCVCSNRGFRSVPQYLPTDITQLDLSRNAITTLSQSDFSRYRSLRSLDLGSNQISMIHNNTFHNLIYLYGLDLNDNRLTNLTAGMFVGLGNLEELDLDSNNIHSIEAGTFNDTTKLRILDLQYNSISTFTAGMFVGLGNLQELRLYRNDIHSIEAGTFNDTTKLYYLNLQYNSISTITAGIFVGLGNVDWLDLDNNNIHSIEAGTFNHTTKLHDLYLHHNNISTITADTFGNLPLLQTLYLSHNNINTFPVEALSNLNIAALSELTLDSNQLETLPLMAYDILASISYINIDNNPWQCDCWMVPFRQRMSGSHQFENQITCAGPANIQGQYLRDVNPEDLICEETSPVYSTSTTKHITDSTLSLSPVSSSSPFHQSATSTPKPLTLSPSQNNTPTADSKPHLSTVSTGSPFGFQSTMTESNTGPADGGIVLSVPILATLGAIVGLLLICTIGFAVGCMYKRRQRDPTPQQGFSNTNPTSSGHDQIGLNTVETNINAEVNTQSRTPHLGREDSQHIYNLPTDEDPDTAEYNTIDDIDQSESPHQDAGNRLSLDSFGYLNLTPSLPPKNQTGPRAAAHIESADAAAHTTSVAGPSQRPGSGQIQHLGSSNDGYEVPSPSLYPGEGPQSHKYVNSHVAAAAKDAAAGPQDVVYENGDETAAGPQIDDESDDNQSQTVPAPGADSPHHYEPLRNPSSQQQHTYTSLMPHGSHHQ